MADLKPSTARTEQCTFIAGKPPSSSAASFQLIFFASSIVFPFARSVMMEAVAIFEAHP
jgi:hypothetical protein